MLQKTHIFLILISIETVLLPSLKRYFHTKKPAIQKNTQEALSAEIWRRTSSEGTAAWMWAAPQISTKQIIFSSTMRRPRASLRDSKASLKINDCWTTHKSSIIEDLIIKNIEEIVVAQIHFANFIPCTSLLFSFKISNHKFDKELFSI